MTVDLNILAFNPVGFYKENNLDVIKIENAIYNLEKHKNIRKLLTIRNKKGLPILNLCLCEIENIYPNLQYLDTICDEPGNEIYLYSLDRFAKLCSILEELYQVLKNYNIKSSKNKGIVELAKIIKKDYSQNEFINFMEVLNKIYTSACAEEVEEENLIIWDYSY